MGAFVKMLQNSQQYKMQYSFLFIVFLLSFSCSIFVVAIKIWLGAKSYLTRQQDMSSVSLNKLNPQYILFSEKRINKRGRESRTGKVIIFISCTNYFRLMRCFLIIYLNFQISNKTNRMCLPTYFLSSLLPSLRKKVLFNWIRSSQLSSPGKNL